ncbi:hypothetical protein CGRA01v4_15027 [Colletotrichum graminicola]|nr:hypothetical protein CGRA01v4_15027 [Colletotrichum graminicola]
MQYCSKSVCQTHPSREVSARKKSPLCPSLPAGNQWIACIVEQEALRATGAYLFAPTGSSEHFQLAQRYVDAFIIHHYIPASSRGNFLLIWGATGLQTAVEDSGIHAFFAVLLVISRKPVCGTVNIRVARHLLAIFLRAEVACPVPDHDREKQGGGNLAQFTREN